MGRRRSDPDELVRQLASLLAGPVVETILRDSTDLMRRSVPFDDWIWLTYDPQTMLPTAAIDDGQSWQLRLAHCANEHLDDDVNKFRALARAPVPVATLDQATRGARCRSPRYNNLLRPHGIERELRAALVTDGLCWGSLTLLRGNGADFSADEVTAIAGITDIVAQRLRQAARLAPARRRTLDGPGEAPGPGIVVVGPDGELERVTPVAEPWLRLLSGEEDRAAPGRPAPVPIAGLAVRARAEARQRKPDDTATPPLRVRTPTGEWLTIHAVPDLDAPAGQHITLVLEPSRPGDLLPLLARAYRLTPREEQIVRLVIASYSTREITHHLGISPHTVQDHLKAVFDKTGVRSRRELAYQFALAYW